MNKIKSLFFSLFSLILISSVFVACDHSGEEEKIEEITVKSISVDSSKAKVLYKEGDSFSTDGLVVTATLSNRKIESVKLSDCSFSGYSSNIETGGGTLVITNDAKYQELSIKVTYSGKSASYLIGISKEPSRIEIDDTYAVKDFFVGDEINLSAVNLASDAEEQESGFIVRAFYLNEGDEGYETEVGEVVTAGVKFTSVDSTESGKKSVKATFLDVESNEVELNVYSVSGTYDTEYEKDAAVPSLSGIKVYLGEDLVEEAEVALYFGEQKYTESTFAVGDYAVVVKVGTAVKNLVEFTVARPDSEKFKIIESESKVEGAALQIVIDASDMNVKWAENLENVKPEVSLSVGTVSEDPGAFFTAPVVNDNTGIVEKFTIQVVLTSPVTTTVADINATIAGTKYKASARFVGDKLIPSNYVPAQIVLDKPSVELACGSTSTFKVSDKTYGLDYSSDVIWSLTPNTTGSTIENGTFTAADVDAETTVAVRASLKSNPEVYAEASVKINPKKADVSGIYNVSLSSGNDTGAWVKLTVTWNNADYKITDVSKASFSSCKVNEIVAKNFADDKAEFQLNGSSAEFRGKSGTISFRAKAANDTYYDVVVSYTESDYNPPSSAGTYSVLKVAVEEAVLNPKLILPKDSIEVQKDGNAVTVEVSYDEILNFDASKLRAVSSSDNVSASFSGTTLSISGSAMGEAVVTISYDGIDSISEELTVNVVAELPAFSVNLNTAVDGAWIYIDVFWTDPANEISVSNNSISNILMNDIENNKYIGDASALTNGVRFGYEFKSADFQNGEHTLSFRIQTSAGKKYDFTVNFTGASGSNVDMTVNSTNFSEVE